MFWETVSGWTGEGGHGSSHVARVDASNSLAVAIISSQLMSRLAAALLRRVLHLEPVAVLLVEAGEVGNRRVLGGGVRGWAHSSSWEGFGGLGQRASSAAGGCVVWRSRGAALEGRSGWARRVSPGGALDTLRRRVLRHAPT